MILPLAPRFAPGVFRPVLVQHCYECHSQAAAEKGKLQPGSRDYDLVFSNVVHKILA